jgi:hypothetical protein
VRFLLDPTSSVQWEKIEKLPDGAVSKQFLVVAENNQRTISVYFFV